MSARQSASSTTSAAAKSAATLPRNPVALTLAMTPTDGPMYLTHTLALAVAACTNCMPTKQMRSSVRCSSSCGSPESPFASSANSRPWILHTIQHWGIPHRVTDTKPKHTHRRHAGVRGPHCGRIRVADVVPRLSQCRGVPHCAAIPPSLTQAATGRPSGSDLASMFWKRIHIQCTEVNFPPHAHMSNATQSDAVLSLHEMTPAELVAAQAHLQVSERCLQRVGFVFVAVTITLMWVCVCVCVCRR